MIVAWYPVSDGDALFLFCTSNKYCGLSRIQGWVFWTTIKIRLSYLGIFLWQTMLLEFSVTNTKCQLDNFSWWLQFPTPLPVYQLIGVCATIFIYKWKWSRKHVMVQYHVRFWYCINILQSDRISIKTWHDHYMVLNHLPKPFLRLRKSRFY